MNKKDISEIRRRFTKDGTSIDRVAGCYVNASKEIVTKFNTTFLNLEDEDFFKYLEIAKKSLSGKVGNNLMQLSFKSDDGSQKRLMSLRDSKLKNSDVLNEFYNHIIDTYDTLDSYLILLFHDSYDVPVKTSDNIKMDDSEEVFEYVICAICPMKLPKAALGYKAADNSIAHITRDWIVSGVESAFMYPAFSDRAADISSICTYTKTPKDPNTSFWLNTLDVKPRLTAAMKQDTFADILYQATDEENREDVFINVNIAVDEYVREAAEKDEIVNIDAKTLHDILVDAEIDDEIVDAVTEDFGKQLGKEHIHGYDIVDEKILRNSDLIIENKVLKERIVSLMAEMETLKNK